MSNRRSEFERLFLGEWPTDEQVTASTEIWCCYFLLMDGLDERQGSHPKNDHYYSRANQIYTSSMTIMASVQSTYVSCQEGKKSANRMDPAKRRSIAEASKYLPVIKKEINRDKRYDY